MAYVAFTHAGLTTRKVFLCCQGYTIYRFMKKIESLLKTASMKFEFSNLEIRFYKRQVSFMVVKTVKCKRGIRQKRDMEARYISSRF